MLIDNCQQVVELVTAYLEGDLAPEDARQVESHLSGCPGCDAYLAQLRLTVREVGRVDADRLPDDVRSALLAAFVANTSDGDGGGGGEA